MINLDYFPMLIDNYGKDSEVLIEFGLQPYRGRSSAPKPPAPEAPEPADPVPAPDPAK
jgi:hypothetical protein